MSAPAEWEEVTENPTTHRLKVEGGWIYRVIAWGTHKSPSVIFVPEGLGDRYGSYLAQITEALDNIVAKLEDHS